jgi:type I restriction enzyme S subunit
MQDLLTKGIDENGNIRDEKTHKFKDSPLGRIPEEWEVVSIYEAVNIINGGLQTHLYPHIGMEIYLGCRLKTLILEKDGFSIVQNISQN